MVDINLLPEDLRKIEESIKEQAKKKPHIFDVPYSNPQKFASKDRKGVTHAPHEKKPRLKKKAIQPHPRDFVKEAVQKQGFFTRVFAHKPKYRLPKLEPEHGVKKNFWQALSPFRRRERSQAQDIHEEKKQAHMPQEKTPIQDLREEPVRVKSSHSQDKAPLSQDFLHDVSPEKILERDLHHEVQKKAKKKKSHVLAVNLIPDDLSYETKVLVSRKILAYFATLCASALVIALVWGGLLFYQSDIAQKSQTLEDSIVSVQNTIKTHEEDLQNMRHLEDRLNALENLLTNHVYWTRVFAMLEKYTINDVYFKSFNASQEGSIVLTAVGLDYESVARQLVAFEEAKDFAKDVSINSASAAVSGKDEEARIDFTNFDVTVELVPDVFYSKLQGP